MSYKNKKRINKNGYVVVEENNHPKSFNTGAGIIGVYEHVLVAEERVVDRSLKEGEVVHHLDQNRSNNSPDNLLVLEGPMHAKLHSWIKKNTIIPTEEYANRLSMGCIRCAVCEKPISPGFTYCSEDCFREHLKNNNKTGNGLDKPDADTLKHEVSLMPLVKIAEKYGVSDVAIKKWCKKDNIETPGRGYWAKLKAGKIK